MKEDYINDLINLKAIKNLEERALLVIALKQNYRII